MNSLLAVGYEHHLTLYTDESQLGCRPHSEVPYGFKVAALKAAFDHPLQFDSVLWCDAAVWAHQTPVKIFEHIEKHGYVFFHAGWDCGQWTSDVCLKNMGVTRDEAKKMAHYSASCFGLSPRDERCQEFLRRLIHFAHDGTSFPGSWTNENGQVSSDPYCLGHRHDQAVGSILAAQLGMIPIIGHETYFAYYSNPARSAFQWGAENDMSLIQPSVELLTQGI